MEMMLVLIGLVMLLAPSVPKGPESALGKPSFKRRRVNSAGIDVMYHDGNNCFRRPLNVNVDVADRFERLFELWAARGVKTVYHVGEYCYRGKFKRCKPEDPRTHGPPWSSHSWAYAVDFNGLDSYKNLSTIYDDAKEVGFDYLDHEGVRVHVGMHVPGGYYQSPPRTM